MLSKERIGVKTRRRRRRLTSCVLELKGDELEERD